MPVDFLTADQEQQYGRYLGEPSLAQLARYFHLDDVDRALVLERRDEHVRLGLAVQLGTVRFLGTFLPDPTAAPAGVASFLALQLGIADPGCLARYASRPATQSTHTQLIRERYGYRDFAEQPEHFHLVRWLYGRAWLSPERPSVLFDLATARLVERKVLLPGVTVLARLVASIRDRAATRLWRMLARLPSREQRGRLEALLVLPAQARQTPLDRLRRAPTRTTAAALVQALARVREVRALGVGSLDLTRLPRGRVVALARYAAAARAQTIARMPEERRVATLLAFATVLEATAQDDALDLFDLLLTSLLSRVERADQRRRLRTLRDLDAAALRLRAACAILLDETRAAAEVRSAVFQRVARTDLEQAMATVDTLARTPTARPFYADLARRYSHVRRFLPAFLATIDFESSDGGRPVLEAIRFLRRMEQAPAGEKPKLDEAPLALVNASWRPHVLRENHQVDRRLYTFCVLERLQDALRRRDLFVSPSERWGDPRAKLLQGPAWEAVRADVCRALGRSVTPAEELARLQAELAEAYRRTAEHLPDNAAVRIEPSGGRDTLVVTSLDRLEEPASLIALRRRLVRALPQVELPEVLLEVHAWTGFGSAFTHISEGGSSADDLVVSICAALLAEACNIPLEPLIHPEVPALTRDRLAWVRQNYLRAETLTRANALLVDYQAGLPLAQRWGGGEVASADGLRFIVPVRTLNAGPNPKYFGVGRGITYYNFTSDQFTGFHAIVIPGTLRDSLFILDGLLEQQTSLQPVEVMTDTAGYSDQVFGLFWLLGYQFSPRLADLGETRFWRLDDDTDDYGPLQGLARQRVNAGLISRNWDDLLRVAGSLKMGRLSASELLRTFQTGGRSSTLARALAELGRVAKTLYLLEYIDDEAYRRRILVQLNRGEARHSLARALFHGHKGEVRQRYRDGQEDQLGALGLVLNAIVLWNTRYLGGALDVLRARDRDLKVEDETRLSPLVYDHVNLLGRYSFVLNEALVNGDLRPFRDPDAPDTSDLGY